MKFRKKEALKRPKYIALRLKLGPKKAWVLYIYAFLGLLCAKFQGNIFLKMCVKTSHFPL